MKDESKTICFVIMPISNQVGYEDKHFQYVYEDIIIPAVKAAGMEPLRADETKNTNLIHLDILKNVIKSPMAICDMSAKNPNVFYELGLRQAFDLPTVLLKDDKTEAPFDIGGLRYCDYSSSMKHRDVKDAIERLTTMLFDTYKKRNDKDEVNSLIRLLELTTPAKVPTSSLSGEEKESALTMLKLDSLIKNVDDLSQKLNKADVYISKAESDAVRYNTQVSGFLARDIRKFDDAKVYYTENSERLMQRLEKNK
ncbi:hypothetical protein VXS03_14020 [Photobacterium sp. S4TG1]|uniref:hypothetical protein n=1 Tax=Photobacterium sp. S4TG1 TaxID=3114587 RepID=UPI002E18A399|nr:hypothetical protein [Photobacterium sp. S4TG1]